MSIEEKTTKVVQTYDLPIEIGLSRSAKGQYYWKVNVKADSPLSALRQVGDIDQELRHRFTEATTSMPMTASSLEAGQSDSHSRMESSIVNVKRAGQSLVEPKGGEAP